MCYHEPIEVKVELAGTDTMLPSCSSLALNLSHKVQWLGPLSNKPSLCPHILLLFSDAPTFCFYFLICMVFIYLVLVFQDL